MKAVRPKFENPPLIERAITVVFEPLTTFTLGDFGLFWSLVKDRFPVSEAVPPLDPEIEQFDGPQPSKPQLRLVAGDVLPRAYFRNAGAGELIQVQPDRFSFNWIKCGPDHRYPHSEATLDRFFELLEEFTAFAAARGMGQIKIIQCELTNVNAIPVGDVGDSFADFGTVVKLPDWRSTSPNVRLEQQAVATKHLLLDDSGATIGRIHAVGQPTLREPDGEPTYRLDITARGAPIRPGVEGVQQFFEAAVSGVNAVFLAMVTQAGRQLWGERNGDSI